MENNNREEQERNEWDEFWDKVDESKSYDIFHFRRELGMMPDQLEEEFPGEEFEHSSLNEDGFHEFDEDGIFIEPENDEDEYFEEGEENA